MANRLFLSFRATALTLICVVNDMPTSMHGRRLISSFHRPEGWKHKVLVRGTITKTEHNVQSIIKL